MSRSLDIAVIASARYPISQPFAGGLEAQTWDLVHGLRRRGHRISLFAGPGSDPSLGAAELPVEWPRISDDARADVSMPPEAWMAEHHAYLQLMLSFSRPSARRYDVVHNNSLHHLPIAMAASVPARITATLHTPPTPWLESAIQTGPCPVEFVAVSQHTATVWRHAVPSALVIPNGIDLAGWRVGPGGDRLIWFGRIVPEKGPHHAIAAARIAGLALDLAGPVADRRYFEEAIVPHLGPDVRYLGHLDRSHLTHHVGRALASVLTPCWDEPYGLVAAESLACGTPVASFDRGGIAEVIDASSGVLAGAGDVPGLAQAIRAAAALSRPAARRRAELACSSEVMIDRYETLFTSATGTRAA